MSKYTISQFLDFFAKCFKFWAKKKNHVPHILLSIIPSDQIKISRSRKKSPTAKSKAEIWHLNLVLLIMAYSDTLYKALITDVLDSLVR